MKKPIGALSAVLLTFFLATPAWCFSVVGIAEDQNHQFVNGADVTVTDATGKTAGTGRTDLYGRYCIPLGSPGKYTVAIDPTANQLKGGSTATDIDITGATVDWSLSPSDPALAKTEIGVASAAAVTCGAAPWYTSTTALAAGGVLLGGGGIACGFLCGGGGGGGAPASAAK